MIKVQEYVVSVFLLLVLIFIAQFFHSAINYTQSHGHSTRLPCKSSGCTYVIRSKTVSPDGKKMYLLGHFSTGYARCPQYNQAILWEEGDSSARMKRGVKVTFGAEIQNIQNFNLHVSCKQKSRVSLTQIQGDSEFSIRGKNSIFIYKTCSIWAPLH